MSEDRQTKPTDGLGISYLAPKADTYSPSHGQWKTESTEFTAVRGRFATHMLSVYHCA